MPGQLVPALSHLLAGSTSHKRWYTRVEGLLDQGCWLVLVKQEPRATGPPSPPPPCSMFGQEWGNVLVWEQYRLWRPSCVPSSVKWGVKMWCGLMLEKREGVVTVGDTILLAELPRDAGPAGLARVGAHRHM